MKVLDDSLSEGSERGLSERGEAGQRRGFEGLISAPSHRELQTVRSTHSVGPGAKRMRCPPPKRPGYRLPPGTPGSPQARGPSREEPVRAPTSVPVATRQECAHRVRGLGGAPTASATVLSGFPFAFCLSFSIYFSYL